MVSTCLRNFRRLAAKVSHRSSGSESVRYIQTTEQSWDADGAGACHVYGSLRVPFTNATDKWWVGEERSSVSICMADQLRRECVKR